MNRTRDLVLSLVLILLPCACATHAATDGSLPITHGFLACGAETYILDGQGREIWRHPLGTRDGEVLANGNVLLAITRQGGEGARYPGGGAIEVTRDGKVVWEYLGTQSEVNTAQRLANGNTVVTEAGPKPRLLEIDPAGKVVVEFPIQCQLQNHHMQSRMTRKLQNGDYLVPQLFDFVVREYDATGKVVHEIGTRRFGEAESWPFTAIRLDDGHTLVTLTHSDRVVEFDGDGNISWQLDNQMLGSDLLRDPCGAQRLPNGNTVITSYGRSGKGVKLLEVTPAHQLVWSHADEKDHGIHEFQILDADGRRLPGPSLR
ncbi:MAG: hypothetical protein U1F36_14865 [Planctomycetota bacterium]